MSNEKRKDPGLPAEWVRRAPPEVILRAAELCDGHSILKPEAFTDAGLSEDVVRHLSATYRSNGTPKGTIYVNGEPVEQLTGIYGLDLLRFLADALGVDYAPALGRGFEARNIQAALQRHFSTPTRPDAA